MQWLAIEILILMMKFKQYFDFSRFFKLLKFDFSFNAKKYLAFIGVLFIVLFFVDLILINSGSSFRTLENNNVEYFFRKSNYQFSFIIAFLIVMIVVVSTAFPAFRKRESTASFLLLPAATLEKFLVEFLIRIIIFCALYIVIFWTDFKLASIAYKAFGFKNNISIPSFGFFDFYSGEINLLDKTVITLSIFSFTTYLFANASHFKKNAILKTIILLGCFGYFIFLVNVCLSHLFLPNEANGFEVKIFNRDLENGLNTVQFCVYIIGTLSSLFFLPFTYFKLKEKQV